MKIADFIKRFEREDIQAQETRFRHAVRGDAWGESTSEEIVDVLIRWWQDKSFVEGLKLTDVKLLCKAFDFDTQLGVACSVMAAPDMEAKATLQRYVVALKMVAEQAVSENKSLGLQLGFEQEASRRLLGAVECFCNGLIDQDRLKELAGVRQIPDEEMSDDD
jgi:hypothetical protein